MARSNPSSSTPQGTTQADAADGAKRPQRHSDVLHPVTGDRRRSFRLDETQELDADAIFPLRESSKVEDLFNKYSTHTMRFLNTMYADLKEYEQQEPIYIQRIAEKDSQLVQRDEQINELQITLDRTQTENSELIRELRTIRQERAIVKD